MGLVGVILLFHPSVITQPRPAIVTFAGSYAGDVIASNRPNGVFQSGLGPLSGRRADGGRAIQLSPGEPKYSYPQVSPSTAIPRWAQVQLSPGGPKYSYPQVSPRTASYPRVGPNTAVPR